MASLGKEFIVGATLHNAALMHYAYHVGILNGTESVSDHERG